MEKGKIKNFFKTHKKDIILVSTGIAVGVAGSLLAIFGFRKKPEYFMTDDQLVLSDLGKLGDEYLKRFGDVLSKDSKVLLVGEVIFGDNKTDN